MGTAIEIPPSLFWEGNDGNWSTIALQLGSQRQVVHVLPATSGSSIWPVNILGCPTLSSSSGPSCNDLRGRTFDQNITSSSFKVISRNDPDNPYFELLFSDSEASIGYAGTAIVGVDSVCFGSNPCDNTDALQDQVVATYGDLSPYVGLLGVSGWANHVRYLNDTDESPLQAMKKRGSIPSLSYGYTAGARYKDPPAFASLTFGGYDSGRGNANDSRLGPVSFGTDSTRDLLVTIKDITIGSGSASLLAQDLGSGITAFIDSVVPEIWLPASACRVFESAFGLVWNDTVGYYLVNDTQHATLQAQDTSVTFKLAANSTASDSITIELPYSAFDQGLQYPLAGISDYETTLRYFPLRRATGAEQQFLGRAFLQEAYLAVDYEQHHFYISQATYPVGQKNLITISGNGELIEKDNGGLSIGAIVGIAVGAATIGIILIAIAFWFWRRRRQQRKDKELQYGVHDVFSRQSMAGTTINEPPTPSNVEYFKPDPPPGMTEDAFKPELDATVMPRGAPAYHRHELSAGSVRRASNQTGISRGTVSPIDNRHTRSMSYGSSNGQPSPNANHSPSPGSPPMSDRGTSWFSSTGPFYELQTNEQAMHTTQVESAEGHMDDLFDVSTLPAQGESDFPPVERPAPLRMPPQTMSPTGRPPLSPPVDRPAID